MQMLGGPTRARKGHRGRLAHPFGFVNRDSDPSGSSNNSDDGGEAGKAGDSRSHQPSKEDSRGRSSIEESGPELTKSKPGGHHEKKNSHSTANDGIGATLGALVTPAVVDESDTQVADIRLDHQAFDENDSGQTNKEYINILHNLTISRDQTEASNFKKERLLAIEDETFEQQQLSQQHEPSSHALQDYQMQLMLLQQQNKKRLLMARQEQGQGNFPRTMSKGPTQESDVPKLYSPGSSTKQTPDYGPKISYNIPQYLFGSGPNAGLLPRNISDQQTPYPYANVPSIAAASVNATAETNAQLGEIGLVNQLLRRIEALEAENKRLNNPLSQVNRSPRFQVFHELAHSHTVCLQEPSWTFDNHGNLELKEELPLIDLETHLRRNDDLAFLIYKSYSTPWISKTELAELLETGIMPSPEPSRESITIRSEELRVAFEIFLRSAYPDEETGLTILGHQCRRPTFFGITTGPTARLYLSYTQSINNR
jgi:hypothetical protein